MSKLVNKIFTAIWVSIFTLSLTFSLVSVPSYAQSLVPDRNRICTGGNCPGIGNTPVDASRQGLVSIIIGVAQWLTFIGVAVSVLFLVWGGFRWITSGEGEAKKIVLNAIVGLIISILAFTIVTIISQLATGNIAGSILGGQ